jgi:hypothetical protein
MRLHASGLLSVLILVACGGSAEPEADPESTSQSSGGEETTAEEGPLPGQPFAPRPELNVYVQGPDPAPSERYQASVATEYRAEIVVTNTGDAPVELSFCMIDFQLVKDDQHITCGDESQTDAAPGPAALQAGEAHVYEAGFHCTIDEPGTYELRAYMNFGAEIAPGEDRERYYVGSREIVVE